jgi:hypothetical protein
MGQRPSPVDGLDRQRSPFELLDQFFGAIAGRRDFADLDLAVALVHRGRGHAARRQHPSKLSQHVAELASWQMLQHVERDETRNGPGSDGQSTEVRGNQREERASHSRDGQHRRREVDTRALRTTSYEILRHLRRPAPEIENESASDAPAGDEIEDTTVEIEVGKVIAEFRGVLVNDRRIRRSNNVDVEPAIMHTPRLPVSGPERPASA